MKSDLRRINRHQMSLLPGKVTRQKQNNPETLSCQLRISFFELDLGYFFNEINRIYKVKPYINTAKNHLVQDLKKMHPFYHFYSENWLEKINRHQMSLLPGKVTRQKQNNPETLSCQLRISFFELDLGYFFNEINRIYKVKPYINTAKNRSCNVAVLEWGSLLNQHSWIMFSV